MQFIKAGQTAESNIFNRLDERKRALIAGGADVINLSIGTPDFQPDVHVMEAVSRAALEPAQYKYSLTETPALLTAVQDWYQRRYGVTLKEDEIMAVCGSQEGIAHVAFAFAGADDLILAPDPGYPIFSFGPMMTGATIGLYPLKAENNWQLDFADIPDDVADRAKAIVVSYPNNPTTAVADRAFYEKLVDYARRHDLIVIHDNAYSDLLLNGEEGLSFLSIPGAKEVGIEFNSLSKTYNLTGMRVSFALGNRDVLARFRAFRSQIDYGMFYPIQAGAVAALTGPQDIVQRNREGYMARRDALCGGLRRIGWDVPDAQGTMFVWAKIPARFASSVDFVLELMEKTGVICVPGSSFGQQGEGYVRFALVVPPERMEEAVRRIDESGILQGKGERTMKIEHVSLYTKDLARARAFYETYFGGIAGALYHNPKTGLQTYFLSFADGARLELMTRPELAETAEGMRVGWAHLAFSTGSREQVDGLTARLRADGYSVVSGPRMTGDGYYESCVLDPDGNTVEITV